MRRFSIYALSVIALLVTLAPPQVQALDDWPFLGGRFFTQAGGGGNKGYLVTDEGGVRFWSEFQRLGGVAAVGYPASQRFIWDGFTTQVFQRVIFQWRPECGCVTFVNVFDRLHDLGQDTWLLSLRQTPPPTQWDEVGKPWSTIVRDRLAVLDEYPAIKAKFFAVAGDPIQANGLPTGRVVDMGNHFVLRAQRVVFQQWKENVPWARKGEVTVALGGDIAKESGLLPDPAALLPVPPSAVHLGSRQVLAYYVPYDPTSWASLQAHPEAIDYVGAQWVGVDPCGGIGSRDDQTVKQFAQSRGIKVFPSLLTSSGWLNHRILTDPAASARALSGIVDYVIAEGYDGFDLDLEGVEAQDRTAYTAFVSRLAAALHERGKMLALAIPAKARDVTTGWAGAYDYAALGQHADLITIMTYDYHGAWGGPGSIAPYDWVDSVVAFAAGQMPAYKVAVGLAFYGYDWNTTSGPVRALRYPQAAELADRYRVLISHDSATQSATFSYRAPAGDPPPSPSGLPPLANRITERKAPSCSVTPPPPSPTPTPRPTPAPGAIQDHVVWIEDAASAGARLSIADRHQTAGIATWRLGQEDPKVWEMLAGWRLLPG